jgi:hypothetical protein
MIARYDAGTPGGPLQITGVNGADVDKAQALSQMLHLHDTHICHFHIRMAIDGESIVADNLAMPDHV